MIGGVFRSVEISDKKVSENYFARHDFVNGNPKRILFWAEFPLPDQRYLLGNEDGTLWVWDMRDNKFSPVPACGQIVPQSGNIYRIIFSHQDQHYWAVGSAGCYRISKELCITDFYGTGDIVDEQHRIPFSDLRDLYEDPEGIFWLATNGEGLLRWDRTNNDFQSITIQDGLPSNTIYCILPDEFGNLWVSTDNGLMRFNQETRFVNVFSVKDGIAHNEFNRVASFKGKDGRMYFGGVDGLTAFHPRDFETDLSAEQIPLQVTGYYQFLAKKNKLTDLTPELLASGNIALRPGDKFFRLEFALLDYRQPANHYKYQIEGFDGEWAYLREPLLRISGLPYGKYTLHVAGQGYSGVWSKKELAIPIHVIRPMYLSWWAFCLYGLAILSFLNFVRTYQIRKLRETADMLRLREIDALKTKLYTNITHEFRTPLTVISGMAEEIEKQPAKAKELILRNTGNLLRLVNQMLDLSKIDSGKMQVQWELGNVISFLQYLSDNFYSNAETRRIKLTFWPEVKSLEMDYDREKMQQIIYNLLSNALKFTPKGGKVVFNVNEVAGTTNTSGTNGDNEHFLQIKIWNSGTGISAEHIKNIFNRFYQVDDTHTRTGEGTGIGLALTKELVELMGGRISVKSEPGEGAEFTVYLPIRKSSARSLDLPLGTKPELATKGEDIEQMSSISKTDLSENYVPPLALLIEDNADVAIYIRTCLQNLYTVIWAENGQLGIEKALETVPDIIISDVMMPEKDGYEVTQFLKNDERTSHIPIILLTAKTDVDSRIRGLEQGADVYLAKPFQKKELMVRLEKLIELRRKLQIRYAGGKSFKFHQAPIQKGALVVGKEAQIEDAFLKKVNEIIEEHLADANFEIPQLCKVLHMSQSQLYRKVKALTGQSIVAYVRSYRLYKGRELLQTSGMNVSEVAYTVGFNDPFYFSRMFSEEFGEPPVQSLK